MKAFEDATGEKLEEEKKEIASEELVTTGDLAEDIGSDKATGIINDIKTEIIKNDTKDTIQIAETIINVTNNYNVTLTQDQQKQIESLMVKIAAQDYDYNKIKDTLENVSNIVEGNLEELGENIKQSGILDTIKGWFTSIGDWFTNLFKSSSSEDLGILGSTNDSVLGDDVTVDATDKNAIELPDKEEVQGFFDRLWSWFTGLFNSDSDNTESESANPQTPDSNPVEDTPNIDTNTDAPAITPEQEENTHFDTNKDNTSSQDGTSDETPSVEHPQENTN